MPCAKEPERFFGDDNDEDEKYDTADAKVAAELCLKCPLRWPCLEDAFATGEQYGVRGGMTPEQRQRALSRGWVSEVSEN